MTTKGDLSGKQLGEFLLRELIGEGAFGAVYGCEQSLLGRAAVVKVLHDKLRGRDVAVQRFLREAQLASRLDHPYAAHVYAFGIEKRDRLLWIAMERVQGVTLAEWLRTHGPMPLGQLVAFFEHIASVVQTAHERGIVHRDLKPSNVMVIERAGELLPKLLDFGVAKMVDGAALLEGMPDISDLPPPAGDDLSGNSSASVVPPPGKSTVTAPSAPPHPDDDRLTQNNHTVGSPPYISPEQWNNSITVGPASDLYALAVVAFEALTGRRPFQGATVAEYAELHRRGKVPSLGGSFPPALNRMFQRALAKRPEDRWSTALELAAALRAASGIGATRADLPRIDHDVRDAWLAEAPQPLAESMAALDDAHNAHQARDVAECLIRTLLRYLLAMTIVMNARVHEDDGDPALLELVRALDRRDLGVDKRIRLLRRLVWRLTGPRRVHAVPELIELLPPNPGGTDPLDPILALYTAPDHAISEEAVRLQLLRLIPVLTQLLRRFRFVLDYVLVVPRDDAAERWTGRRRQPRAPASVSGGALVDGHPMLLDRAGQVCLDLWPLVQAVPPMEGAAPELFLLDGHGPDGALLIATPSGLEHHDTQAGDWVTAHVVAEIESKTRMRGHLGLAAREWQDRARPNALLWRGKVLADFERWARCTSGLGSLGDLELAFVMASRRAAQRTRWIRGSLVAMAVAGVLAGLQYQANMQTQLAQEQALRAQQQARMAQQEVTQAEVEEGRQALLHDESEEAQLHLFQAYQRGDHSRGVEFMLARAVQPRLAEKVRFASTQGRMWSAAFSPDGRQIVTTDERNAQIWDARSNQLLFTLRHGSEVYHAVYNADGAKLVTATTSAIRIWDAASGALVHELRQRRSDGKPEDYYLVALSPDGKLVSAIDATGALAHVWDAGTGAPLEELRNNASEFPSQAFSSDGRWLATSGGDDVRVFDTTTWKLAGTLATTRVRSLSFDPTGPRLLTGTAAGDATIWQIPSGARVHHLREVGEPVDKVAFSPDGQLVVTASRDGAEQVWNAASGTLQSQGNYLRGTIESIEFDPSSTLVVAAGASGTVVVADAEVGMPVAVLEGSQMPVRVVHFDPTSRRVVSASRDGSARVSDATSPYRRWNTPPIHDDCGLVMSLEPDRRFIAIGCKNHATRVWDTSRDQLLAELPSVTQVDGDFASAYPAVSAGGDRAAIARGKVVAIYGLPGGQLLRTILHRAAISAVAFAGTGHDLVSGTVDGSVLVTRDGHEPIVMGASPFGIDAAGFLADGRVVTVNATRRMQVYEADRDDEDRRSLLAEVEVPTRVGLLRPSQDGRRLITVPSYTGNTAPAVLWDLEHYRIIATLEGNVGQVLSARFAASDRAILTTGNDGAVRLWDGATGQPRQTYRANSRFFADATLSPDGSMVVAGDANGMLRFWDASSGRPLWTLWAHKSHVVGIHFEDDDIVTRGFAGDISRWTLPKPERVIAACGDHAACGIVSK